MSKPPLPERALIAAALSYAATVAEQGVSRICLTLSDGSKRRIDPPALLPPSDHSDAASDRAGDSLAGKLLRCLLSADGMQILRLIADRGSAEAKVIAAGCNVERSKCYTLIADLRERGLIRDNGHGYAVADPEVWAAVSATACEA